MVLIWSLLWALKYVCVDGWTRRNATLGQGVRGSTCFREDGWRLGGEGGVT